MYFKDLRNIPADYCMFAGHLTRPFDKTIADNRGLICFQWPPVMIFVMGPRHWADNEIVAMQNIPPERMINTHPGDPRKYWCTSVFLVICLGSWPNPWSSERGVFLRFYQRTLRVAEMVCVNYSQWEHTDTSFCLQYMVAHNTQSLSVSSGEEGYKGESLGSEWGSFFRSLLVERFVHSPSCCVKFNWSNEWKRILVTT